MERPYAQSFEKHARILPTYHGLTFGIFTVNLGWSLYRTATGFSWESLLSLLLAAPASAGPLPDALRFMKRP